MELSPRNRAVRYFWICCAWCAALQSSVAAGSQTILLQLRNGDRLSGSFIAEDSTNLSISNSILGKVAVPLDQIEKRESLPDAVVAPTPIASNTNANVEAAIPSPTISPADQKRLVDLQAAYVTGQLSAEEYHRQRSEIMVKAEVGTGGDIPASVASALPKPVSPPVKPAPAKTWTGDLSIGTDMAFGEKTRDLYSGRLKVSYAQAPVRNYLDYLFTYGRTRGQLSANRMDGQMKTDIDLTGRTYLYSLLAAGYDEIRRVDWRYDLGPGVGYNLIKSANFVARVEGGFHYQVQNFQGGRQDESYFNRLAQDSRWNIGSQFTFDQKTEYLPRLYDLEVYRLRLEANLRYWLLSNLSLNLTVINTYDTATAKGVGQNDLQLKSSIGVKF